jgi:hypothetical protein
MSKQREALEKAIDALAFIHKFSHTAIDQIDEIREALAEPEQKPVAVVTSLTGDPVTMSWHHEPALPIGTKLYTSPPTRKPLTDSELWEMWVESPSDVLRFARAIERAHGITE